MKAIKLLILTASFLIMISSVLTVMITSNRTPVYLNIGAMVCLVIIITLMNLDLRKRKQ